MISSEQIIYLDNNATTPVDPAVFEAMRPFYQHYGNPSSGYRFGARCETRSTRPDRVAGLLGCEPSEIVFTSCGTESNNVASIPPSSIPQDKPHRHDRRRTRRSAQPLKRLAKLGYEVTFLGVDRDGKLDLDELATRSAPTPRSFR